MARRKATRTLRALGLVAACLVFTRAGAGEPPPSLEARLGSAPVEEARGLLLEIAQRGDGGTPEQLLPAMLRCRVRLGDGADAELRMGLLALGEGAETGLRSILVAGPQELRKAALWSMSCLCPRGPETERITLALLEDADPEVRFAAARALSWTRRAPGGPAAAALARHLGDAYGVGSEALRSLVQGDEGDADGVGALRAALASNDRLLPSTAVRAARMIGLRTDALRPALLRIATNRSEAGITRLWALESLRVQGRPGGDALAACRDLLAERALDLLRIEAVKLAGEQASGAGDEEAWRCVELALSDDVWAVCRAGAHAARHLGPGAEARLLALLATGTPWQRQASLLALESLGRGTPEARRAVSRLLEESRDDDLRMYAIPCLAALGAPPDAIEPAIRSVLAGGYLPARYALVTWLATRGAELHTLGDVLRRIALDREDPVGRDAIRALAAVTKGHAELEATLRTLLASDDEMTRCLAAVALVGTRPSSPPEEAVAVIRRGLHSPDADFIALEGVRRLAGGARWAAPRLRELLLAATSDWGVQQRCAEALAALGAWDPTIEETLLSIAVGDRPLEARVRAIRELGRAPRLTRRSLKELRWLAVGDPEEEVRAPAQAAWSAKAR